MKTERLSVVEKIGYGLGDSAAGFVFQTMVIFQLAFYTDTFGITAAAAGTLLAAGNISKADAAVLSGLLGALLIALPAVSLPSAVMVGRALGWRATAATAGATVVAGLLAGGLLTALS